MTCSSLLSDHKNYWQEDKYQVTYVSKNGFSHFIL